MIDTDIEIVLDFKSFYLRLIKDKSREKRDLTLEVAKDVLTRIKANKLIPIENQYAILNSDESDLQTYLNKPEAICYVCQLGSAFVSYVGLYDNFQVSEDELNRRTDVVARYLPAVKKLLEKFLFKEELWLLEAAFEKDLDFINYRDFEDTLYEDTNNDSKNYYRYIYSIIGKYAGMVPEEAMPSLWQEIINNDGALPWIGK